MKEAKDLCIINKYFSSKILIRLRHIHLDMDVERMFLLMQFIFLSYKLYI